ncbi:hypothetical protein MXB_1846 [Myxobolus squamalis]|nr:hypothetical protein MXB_1846 [Myxobolus squamalis]
MDIIEWIFYIELQSYAKELYFNVGKTTFDRLLISGVPLFDEFTLCRIRIHLMYMPFPTLLKLGSFKNGIELKQGSLLIVIELLEWNWCSPCFNVSQPGKPLNFKTLDYGRGISFSFNVSGILAVNKIGKMKTKINELNFPWARIIFPNTVFFSKL